MFTRTLRHEMSHSVSEMNIWELSAVCQNPRLLCLNSDEEERDGERDQREGGRRG